MHFDQKMRLRPCSCLQGDRILHALPLHHIHGNVVGLYAAHAAGAAAEFLPKFSPTAVWNRLMVRRTSVLSADGTR